MMLARVGLFAAGAATAALCRAVGKNETVGDKAHNVAVRVVAAGLRAADALGAATQTVTDEAADVNADAHRQARIDAANDRIDSESNERKASEKRVEAVQMLVDIIEDTKAKKANVSKAKELYSDISGHEWNGIEEAEKYLADPDNYDPDAADEPPGLVDAEAEDVDYAEPVPDDEDGDPEDAEEGEPENPEGEAQPTAETPQP